MSQWHLSIDGKQFGPMSREAAAAQAASAPSALAWREGFAQWLPAANVAELQAPSQPPALSTQKADQIDYTICGTEMQYVEVELDPGESVVAEAGALMYKDPAVQMETIFGDSQSSSFMDKLMGAGKRLLTGESLFITLFTNRGSGKSCLAFAAPFPGNIVPLSLSELGGKAICQKDSFLCAARGVSIGIHFQRRILTGLFGGEGFIMQKLEGDGLVFVHAGGTLCRKTLAAGESLHVDTGCVVGFESTVDFNVEQVGGIKSMLFGGEGVFLAHLRGPGRVLLQSLPFSRLAGRMLAATAKGRDESSPLGSLGKLLQGDNRF